MRVVIDTNVLVSALLKESGSEAKVMFAIADGRLIWCVSPAIVAEYTEVLQRPKFSRIPAAYVQLLLGLASEAQMFHPQVRLKISSHEEDNRFYECAVTADADFIVTGNSRHFPDNHGRTRITSARQMAGRLLTLS